YVIISRPSAASTLPDLSGSGTVACAFLRRHVGGLLPLRPVSDRVVAREGEPGCAAGSRDSATAESGVVVATTSSPAQSRSFNAVRAVQSTPGLTCRQLPHVVQVRPVSRSFVT